MRVTEEERGIPRRGPGRILKQSPKASSCRLSNTTSSHVRTAFRPMVSGPRKTAQSPLERRIATYCAPSADEAYHKFTTRAFWYMKGSKNEESFQNTVCIYNR